MNKCLLFGWPAASGSRVAGLGRRPVGGLLLSLFHRLAEAITFAIHLEDAAMVRQSIEQGGGHAFPLKDLAPFAERQVAGQQQAAAFVAFGKDLKE